MVNVDENLSLWAWLQLCLPQSDHRIASSATPNHRHCRVGRFWFAAVVFCRGGGCCCCSCLYQFLLIKNFFLIQTIIIEQWARVYSFSAVRHWASIDNNYSSLLHFVVKAQQWHRRRRRQDFSPRNPLSPALVLAKRPLDTWVVLNVLMISLLLQQKKLWCIELYLQFLFF